jgi:hypothetical protein
MHLLAIGISLGVLVFALWLLVSMLSHHGDRIVAALRGAAQPEAIVLTFPLHVSKRNLQKIRSREGRMSLAA